MICTIIKGPTIEEIHSQCQQALRYSNLMEWRLDLFFDRNFKKLLEIKKSYPLPCIFTLRPHWEGGAFMGTEEERKAEFDHLLALKPEFCDIEWKTPRRFLDAYLHENPDIKKIVSYHHFGRAPPQLKRRIQAMFSQPADYYKIAVHTHSLAEVMDLFALLQKSSKPLLAMSLGEHGPLTRILGKKFGAPWVYASAFPDEGSGLMDVQSLCEVYRINTQNSKTKIFGLVGNPVSESISHLTHNAIFQKLGMDAVYVKIRAEEKELPTVLELMKKLTIHGLSITMPYKEAFNKILYCHNPINTLMRTKHKILYTNTDGLGALEAIERRMSVNERRIVLLGLGGASKAIAKQCSEKGALISIVSRKVTNKENFNQRVKIFSPEHMEILFDKGYDILINCTPHSCPIDEKYVDPNAVIMDIKTVPVLTKLLKKALQKGCKIIPGWEMFLHQAVLQFIWWFGPVVEKNQLEEILREQILSVLKDQTESCGDLSSSLASLVYT
ncbi:MAG: bifunctional 3-dehydroquinate dehydratase/shikimate dehydrogenase [Chlamydiales bacterium]